VERLVGDGLMQLFYLEGRVMSWKRETDRLLFEASRVEKIRINHKIKFGDSIVVRSQITCALPQPREQSVHEHY
jgi:hypothetical protein